MTSPATGLPVRYGGGRRRSGGRAVPVPRGAPCQGLNNLRTRDALDFLRRHHQHCITAGRWEEPDGASPRSLRRRYDLDALWNDFHTTFQATVPDDEEELAGVLADAVARHGRAARRLSFRLRAPDRRYLEVETHKPDNSVDKLLVAVCNANTRGVAFGKQITELEKRAGEIPVAIVRTTDFPKSGKAVTQIAGMLRRHGRRVVVADADWRRCSRSRRSARAYARPDFALAEEARPLSALDSLQKILKLNALTAITGPPVAHLPAEISTTAATSSPLVPTVAAPDRTSSAAAEWCSAVGEHRPSAGHVRRRTSSLNMRRSWAGRGAARRRRVQEAPSEEQVQLYLDQNYRKLISANSQ